MSSIVCLSIKSILIEDILAALPNRPNCWQIPSGKNAYHTPLAAEGILEAKIVSVLVSIKYRRRRRPTI
jgi:hypothetical protein